MNSGSLDDDDLSPWEAMAKAVRGETLGRAAQAHLRPDGVIGALSQMPLTEILQTLDLGKKSARVDLFFAARRGTVHVHEGQIVRAELVTVDVDFHEGEAAVIELCRDREGFFRIAHGRQSVDRNVQRPTTFVLLEALRMIDEATAARDGGGSAGGVDDGDNGFMDATDTGGSMAVRGKARRTAQNIATSPFDDPDGEGIDVDFDTPTGSLTMPVAISALVLPHVQELVTESEFLVAAGDLNGAQQRLLEAHQISPDNDDVRRRLRHVDEAIDAAKAHAFLEQAMKGGDRAVEFARRATELRPVRDVLLRAVAVFARHRAWEEVADTAEQLLDIDRNDEGALRTLLDARMAMKRWADAHEVIMKLLRASPNDGRLRSLADHIAILLKAATPV